MTEARYKVGDTVQFSGMTGTIKRVEIRDAGFPDYFIQFPHGDGATWAQENELESEEAADAVR